MESSRKFAFFFTSTLVFVSLDIENAHNKKNLAHLTHAFDTKPIQC